MSVSNYDLVNFLAFNKIKKSLGLECLTVAREQHIYKIGNFRVRRVRGIPKDAPAAWHYVGPDGKQPNEVGSCYFIDEGKVIKSWPDMIGFIHFFRSKDHSDFIVKQHQRKLGLYGCNDVYIDKEPSISDNEGYREAQKYIDCDNTNISPYEYACKCLEIDNEAPKVPFNNFVRNRELAPYIVETQKEQMIPQLIDDMWGEGREPQKSNWATDRKLSIPFLETAQKVHWFRDYSNQLQMILGVWDRENGSELHCPFTVWQPKTNSFNHRWSIALPSHPAPPYGAEFIKKCPEAEILITSDLDDVKHNCDSALAKTAFLGYPGDMEQVAFTDFDWSGISERNVCILVEHLITELTPEICTELQKQHDLLSNHAPSNLSIAFHERLQHTNETDLSNVVGFQMDGKASKLCLRNKRLNLSDLRAKFPAYFVDKDTKSAGREKWSLNDVGNKNHAAKYYLENIIPEGKAIVLYAAPSGGKSTLALLWSLIMANGVTLPDSDFKAKRSVKVAYLTSETPEDHTRFLRYACDSYPDIFKIENVNANFDMYPRADEDCSLNLATDRGWQEVSQMADDADVIVIDNLRGMLRGENNNRNWSLLWSKLKPYKAQGKTIIILHHLGKSGDQRGSEDIRTDIDIEYRLEKNDTQSVLLSRGEKVRSHGLQLIEKLLIRWDTNPDNTRFKWTVQSVNDAHLAQTPEQTPAPSQPLTATTTAIKYYANSLSLTQTETKILNLFIQTSRKDPSRHLSSKDIADCLGCDTKTARIAFTKLARIIEDNGAERKGKGYRLTTETRNTFVSNNTT